MENCHRIFTSRDKNLQLKFGGSFIHDNNILAMIEEAFEDTSVSIDKLELTEFCKESEILEILEPWTIICDNTEIGDKLLDRIVI